MKFQIFVATALSLFTLTSAAPGVDTSGPTDPHDKIDWSQHQFQPPKDGDIRGPCPGLNTLANHGFLPRDGKNITIPIVLKAGLDGYNVHQDLLLLAAKAALLVSPSIDTFTLGDIAQHGNIEHDASVSRADRNLASHITFNETVYTTLANSNPGVDFYNGTSAGLVQKARTEQSKAQNPGFRNTIKEFSIRTRESALYLSVVGNPVTGVAPKQFVDIFFREERLPLAEGWKVPLVQVNTDTDRVVRKQIVAASQWQPEPEQCPWVVLVPGGAEDPIHDGTIV